MNLFSPNVNPGINLLSILKFFTSWNENEFQSADYKKLKDILNLIFKRDIEFYTKLRNILTKNFLNFYVEIMERISTLLYKKTSQKSSTFFIDK